MLREFFRVLLIGVALGLIFCGTFVVMSSLISACYAAEVTTEERVIDLPQDSEKWFVSVVGDAEDPQFQAVLQWFNEDEKLKDLKGAVHFWKIASNSTAYETRYKHNVKGLPTVRIQEASGAVIYEGVGEQIPASADDLYREISDSSTGRIINWPILNRPILPWRRHIERERNQQPSPAPCPGPDCAPVPPDPTVPPLSDGGPPQMDSGPSAGLVLALSILSLLGGGAGGLISQWRRTYRTDG